MASSRFLALLAEQADTHIRKSAGYAGRDNPDTWANFRNATGWGVTPFIGCMVRLTDKFVRAQNLTRDPGNDQVGEDLRATLIDLGNYAMIGVCILDEQRLGAETPSWPAMAFAIASPAYRARLDAVARLYEEHVDGSDPDRTIQPLLEALGAMLEETTVA